jgi:hypothetical protein
MVQNAAVRNDIIKKTYDWFMAGVGISDKSSKNHPFLGQNYPNPANSETTILLSHIDRTMVLEVTDITGRTIQSEAVNTGTQRVHISTSSLSTGMYFYRLVSGGKVVDARKLSVER